MAKTHIKIRYKRLAIIVIVFLLFVILIVPKNYTKKYKRKDIEVTETYNKTDKRYNITLKYNDRNYDYNFTSHYRIFHKIIKKVEVLENNKETCLIPTIRGEKSVPLCIQNDIFVDFNIINSFKEQLTQYTNKYNTQSNTIGNINTFNLLDKYLIWNYKNFIYIDSKKNETISLFDKDFYNIDMAAKVGNYLIIPNYESEYNYKEMFILNIKNLKTETWKLNYEITSDSYVLGTYKDSVYIVDRKNKVEYELNVKRKRMKIVGKEQGNGIIYDNGLSKISMIKLLNNTMSFNYNYDQYYSLENNKIFLNTKNNKILISNNKPTSIIYSNDTYVYYMVNDSLYYYDQISGEIKIMSSFEWNFNNENKIFIY